MQREFLPYSRQVIDDDDIRAVTQTLKSDFLTTGPMVEAFEKDLAHLTGAKHAVVCANGTAALHLAYLGSDIGPGDKVIVPATTFLATANAVRMCGADVIFADVDPEHGLMGPLHFKQAIEGRSGQIKAVVPVHLAGQVDDLSTLSLIHI